MVQQRLRKVAAVEHIATEELLALEVAATQAAVRGAEREDLLLQRMASTLELNRQQQLLEEAHAAEQVRREKKEEEEEEEEEEEKGEEEKGWGEGREEEPPLYPFPGPLSQGVAFGSKKLTLN